MNSHYSNAKKIKLAKISYTLRAGENATVDAKTILQYPDRKQLSDGHVKEFRFATTDKTVAYVDEKGRIVAKKKGKCFIYIYSRNGLARKLKVIVKQ